VVQRWKDFGFIDRAGALSSPENFRIPLSLTSPTTSVDFARLVLLYGTPGVGTIKHGSLI
jgi:hypothetical protein